MPVSITVREAAQQLLTSQNKDFLVIDNGTPAGTIGREQIIKAIAESGESGLVSDAMDKDLLFLDVNISIEEGLREFQLKGKRLALVTENNQLVGVVDTDNIAEFLMINKVRRR